MMSSQKSYEQCKQGRKLCEKRNTILRWTIKRKSHRMSTERQWNMKWEYPRKKRLKRTSRKGNEGKEQRRVRNKEHHKSERARVVIRTGYIRRGIK